VIVGRPNAGKSSLMNLLLGQDRAIVTDIAGTTRDVLTETVTLDSITLILTDTAGIHHTDDPVEKIGVERARRNFEEADLALCMIDSSLELNEDDIEILKSLKAGKSIVLLNKTDLETVTDAAHVEKYLPADIRIISFSATERTGYEELTDALKDMFISGSVGYNDEVVITNERHKRLLEQAQDSLTLLRGSLLEGRSEDFFTVDLMDAYEALGKIIGESVGEDLVNEIFSRFCMGK